MQSSRWSVEDVAESYARWWGDAGLHSAISLETHGWLAREPANAELPVAPPPPLQLVEAAAPVRLAPEAPAATARDLVNFRAWLAGDAQPEAAWHGPIFVPPAQENLPLLVLCDMPEDGADPALPFAGPAAKLVTAMLGAIGLTADQVGFAPLAMRRPPGGIVDETTFTTLTDRMRHYLALARPRAALILGDRTSRALIATQGADKTSYLPAIQLKDGTVPTAAVAGPELLMRRPMAKAASWQTLRLLHGVLNA